MSLKQSKEALEANQSRRRLSPGGAMGVQIRRAQDAVMTETWEGTFQGGIINSLLMSFNYFNKHFKPLKVFDFDW